MPAAATATELGLRPVPELDGVFDVWPRGERPAAIRAAATVFRKRFANAGEVGAVRTVPLLSVPYTAAYAFGGAARAFNPLVTLVKRLVVVQFDGFDGERRILAWEPTTLDGLAQAPFHARLSARLGELGKRLGAIEHHTLASALGLLGLAPADVDYVAFGSLQLQDLRALMGTVEPVGDDAEPRAPLFPNARFAVQRRELDTLRSVHPAQWAWYVPGGLDDVREDRLAILDGDAELGVGCALLATPGHTDGHQSLCLNAADGIWLGSENGVAADNWHPHLSKVHGVRRWAEAHQREVVLNANTLEDSVDQYDSMLLEKGLADVNRRDPRWHNVLPASELAPLRRQWPVLPTFIYGGIDCGRLEAPGRARAV